MKVYRNLNDARRDVVKRLASQRRAIKMARRTAPMSIPRTIVYARPGELKGMDTLLNNDPPTPVVETTGTNADIFLVNGVSEGPASYQRIGRKLTMKSLRVKGVANLKIGVETTTSDRLGNTLRMIVVYDSQPGLTLPTFAEIFANMNYAGTESPTIMSPLNYKRTFRFKVLRDCLFTLNAESAPTGGTENDWVGRVTFDEYIRLSHETQFTGTATPVGVDLISTGALYVIFRALNNATSSQWNVEETSWARLRYADE